MCAKLYSLLPLTLCVCVCVCVCVHNERHMRRHLAQASWLPTKYRPMFTTFNCKFSKEYLCVIHESCHKAGFVTILALMWCRSDG